MRCIRFRAHGRDLAPYPAQAGAVAGMDLCSIHRNVSLAQGFVGSQVGSQRRQAPGDTRPHPATVIAGSWHAGPRSALSGDEPGLYGMQEVRGSNPLSSTLFRGQRHISILEMIFDFLHCQSCRRVLTSGSGIGVLARHRTAANAGRQPVPTEDRSPGANVGANGDRGST